MAYNNNKNKGTKINPDLVREREKCTFRIEELTNYIDGSQEATAERHARGKHLFQVFRNKFVYVFNKK